MLKRIFKNTDIILAIGILLILGLLLIPLPAFLLDFLFAINIALAITVLVVAIYIQNTLEISVFPGLLLITTLFRLGLSVSSTRLILLDGYAGDVIETFGSFVVGGSYIVGFIIFIILAIVQFMVIVKGSERISEVSARFTLDAMPGKQMAIDADLNSGLINEDDAKKRRETIAREAEFYGSMDGATKFVKGDAIATIFIIFINIIGGIILGIVLRDMEIIDALQTYTILTIGDGLVAQVPALIISTAAGIIVTKGGGKEPMDVQLKTQLLGNPRVLMVVAGAIFIIALVPGIPKIPFLGLGALLVVTVVFLRRQQKEDLEEQQLPQKIIEPEPTEEKIENYLQVDPIEIEIGYGLISLVDESQGGNLFQKIASTRKYLALEYGVLIPPVRVRDNLQLPPNEYIIKIKGNVAAGFEIYTDRFLAMNPGNIDDSLPGIPTQDPAFGLEAVWVGREEKEKAELLGYTVVDSISVLSTHMQETIKKNFDKILTRQAVKQLLENLKTDYPAVIEDVNPDTLPLGTIQKVLQNLLKELVPIKDLVLILEALIDYSKVTKNIDVLNEYVRHSLSDAIAAMYKDHNGVLHSVAVGEALEQSITQSLQQNKDAVATLGLMPDKLMALNTSIRKYLENFRTLGYIPVFITSATIRPYLYRLLNSSFPEIVVLSYTELPATLEVEFLGKIEV